MPEAGCSTPPPLEPVVPETTPHPLVTKHCLLSLLMVSRPSPPRSPGDLVTLCRTNPLSERCQEALVLDRGRYEVRVVADCVPAGLQEGTWR